MTEQKFIDFLKYHKVYTDYLQELKNQDYTMNELINIHHGVVSKDILEDNYVFDYKDQITDVDWSKLSKLWKVFR